MITESQVLDAMRHIIDPDFGKDIVSLGFIKDIKIEDGSVSFSVELTTPACPVKEQFQKACESSVAQLPGAMSNSRMSTDSALLPIVSTQAWVRACTRAFFCSGVRPSNNSTRMVGMRQLLDKINP